MRIAEHPLAKHAREAVERRRLIRIEEIAQHFAFTAWAWPMGETVTAERLAAQDERGWQQFTDAVEYQSGRRFPVPSKDERVRIVEKLRELETRKVRAA